MGVVLGVLLATIIYRYQQRPGPEPVPKESPTAAYAGTIDTQRDYAPMMLVPAGSFRMGNETGAGEPDEYPVHTVYLDDFYIDKYEVTNAQYRRFVKETGYRAPVAYKRVEGEWQACFRPWASSSFNRSDQPIVCVSWEDANAYCRWAGKRLPTEAEWEKAARGGLISAPPARSGNFADETFKKHFSYMSIFTGYNDGFYYAAPVGCFESNRYGLKDMLGNVWEWCSDWYDKGYYASSPEKEPTGPAIGGMRVVRGGAWFTPMSDVRIANRGCAEPAYWYIGVGFRCAKSKEG